MTNRITLAMLAFGALAFSSAALAGEINGSTKNPKSQFSQGASWCKFSGLNDNPSDPNDGPPGRVQNYGHEMLLGLHDPTTGDTPGLADFGCNPTTNPITPETPPQ